MNDKETVVHLREYVKTTHNLFSWATDGCGYDQHMRFVRYRNKHWYTYTGTFTEFILKYADELEKGTLE